MKKYTALLLALLVGCGSESSPTTTQTTQTTQAATATQPDTQIKYLGTQHDTDGTLLEGYAIIHPRKGRQHKPNHPGRGGGGDKGTTNCYSFIGGKAVGWKVAEPYLIDPTNLAGLDQTAVVNSIHQAIAAWDDTTSSNVFGSEVAGFIDRNSIGQTANGQNEIIFAPIAEPGVIAVTYVWGIFSGPPQTRELREWDMIVDDLDFVWGNAGPTDETNLGNTTIMDLLNILTHEFGHALGLGHPPDECLSETMFRFAEEGETKKRTLHAGDIAGLQELYGQ